MQLRLLVELLLNLSPYGLFEEVAEHFVEGDENHGKTDDEILLEALAVCEDQKLVGFRFCLLLTTHVDLPHREQADWLLKAQSILEPQTKARKKTAKKQVTVKEKPDAKASATRRKAA